MQECAHLYVAEYVHTTRGFDTERGACGMLPCAYLSECTCVHICLNRYVHVCVYIWQDIAGKTVPKKAETALDSYA